MLIPRKVKYRKQQRGKMAGLATRGNKIAFGSFALIALGRGRLTSRQIEAARRAMTRYIKREGKIWIRIFPSKSVTQKPTESRMGSGKGAVDHFIAVIKPGNILFEMDGVSLSIAKKAMELAASKLPIKSKFLVRKLAGERHEG
jgi:large subunit ribosomal protein L16